MSTEKDTSPSCLSPEELAQASVGITEHKTTKPFKKCLLAAINAGAFIALAFMFYTTCLADGHGKLVGGLCFALGLILCVIMGGELFTSSTLTLVAKAEKLVTWKQVLKNWTTVYIGNLIGGLFIVLLMMLAREYNAFHGVWGKVILETASHKLHHIHTIEPETLEFWLGFIEAMTAGIFCNIMVCGAVWLSFAGKSLADKMLAMILPVGMFVASGFEHSIANMFMIPAGISIVNFASDEFWQTIGLARENFADLTTINFIVKNLIPVTIGNIIGGGLMIGVYNWYINCRASHKKA
ncbi:MAG: formate transporter FocA [Succinivibrionaceae bacterium]